LGGIGDNARGGGGDRVRLRPRRPVGTAAAEAGALRWRERLREVRRRDFDDGDEPRLPDALDERRWRLPERLRERLPLALPLPLPVLLRLLLRLGLRCCLRSVRPLRLLLLLSLRGFCLASSRRGLRLRLPRGPRR